MANGLKFSEQELADLRRVAYGGYKRTPDRIKRLKSSQTKKIPGGAIDYNFYQGRKPKYNFDHDSFLKNVTTEAEEGSVSANFAKIAKELGIKKVDSTRDLQQMYDYVLGYNAPQQQQQQQDAAPVEETPPTFTPTVLDTGESSNPALFINRFGGNKETMAHSGLKAVKAAEAAGLSIREIQQMAAAQGVQFGIGAQEYFKEKLGPSPQDMFASQISAMQQMFQQSMQQQQQQYMQMQQAQEERMAALQQQMQQAMIAQQTRPEVAGVKMATGSAGTPMQIARRGVTGAFGRRGMRISALNV